MRDFKRFEKCLYANRPSPSPRHVERKKNGEVRPSVNLGGGGHGTMLGDKLNGGRKSTDTRVNVGTATVADGGFKFN